MSSFIATSFPLLPPASSSRLFHGSHCPTRFLSSPLTTTTNNAIHINASAASLQPSTREIAQTEDSGLAALQLILARIKSAGVIACVRAACAELALEMSRIALDSGIDVLEVTMTSPGATQVINRLVEEYPLALIGGGTVLSMTEANNARAAGAKFLMSPVALKELVEVHCHGPILFIPGTMTPTEVLNAYNWGAMMVKLYPVALVGGVQFVQALKKMQCPVPVIASHGITIEMVDTYIAAGATAVVLSDAIFDKMSVSARDFQKIERQAKIAAERGATAAKNFIT